MIDWYPSASGGLSTILLKLVVDMSFCWQCLESNTKQDLC
jgi:hypothetical protein